MKTNQVMTGIPKRYGSVWVRREGKPDEELHGGDVVPMAGLPERFIRAYGLKPVADVSVNLERA